MVLAHECQCERNRASHPIKQKLEIFSNVTCTTNKSTSVKTPEKILHKNDKQCLLNSSSVAKRLMTDAPMNGMNNLTQFPVNHGTCVCVCVYLYPKGFLIFEN